MSEQKVSNLLRATNEINKEVNVQDAGAYARMRLHGPCMIFDFHKTREDAQQAIDENATKLGEQIRSFQVIAYFQHRDPLALQLEQDHARLTAQVAELQTVIDASENTNAVNQLVMAMNKRVNDLIAEREELQSSLKNARALLAHYLETDTVHVGGSDQSGHPHGWCAVRIPDWKVKQALEWMDQDLSKLKESQ